LTASLAPSLCCRFHLDQSSPSATEFWVGVPVSIVKLGPAGKRLGLDHFDPKRAEHANKPRRGGRTTNLPPVPQHQKRN
jgi:hypothetical protein